MITGTQASTNISIHLSFLDKRLVKPLILIMTSFNQLPPLMSKYTNKKTYSCQMYMPHVYYNVTRALL